MKQVADGVVEHGVAGLGAATGARGARLIQDPALSSRDGITCFDGFRYRPVGHETATARDSGRAIVSRRHIQSVRFPPQRLPRWTAHRTVEGSMIRSSKTWQAVALTAVAGLALSACGTTDTDGGSDAGGERLQLQDRCDGRAVRRKRQHRPPVGRRRRARAQPVGQRRVRRDPRASSTPRATRPRPRPSRPRSPVTRPSSVSSVAPSPVRPARRRASTTDAGVTDGQPVGHRDRPDAGRPGRRSSTASCPTTTTRARHRELPRRRGRRDQGLRRRQLRGLRRAAGRPRRGDPRRRDGPARQDRRSARPTSPHDLEDGVGRARRHLLRRLHRRGRAAAQADARRRHRRPVRRW